ncbi:MAG: sigma-70 family RNA polymerase sigma factor [Deltaproteobacteria bacterium]|nr:sigma-70 family RNA polymerase sigma factor [Deltaproteobacteria bacterium]
MTTPDAGTGATLEEHRKLLWGLSYRLTGSAADADDIVQETFLRALEKPPHDTTRPWKPWLVKVATHIGIDRLRRRKEVPYTGPWLPSLIETPPGELEPVADGPLPEDRFLMSESITIAFLLALEVLSPKQRAVLLLRDVFDYSVAETALALEISEADVKTTHHRARALMEPYSQRRVVPDRQLAQQVQSALGNFMSCLMNRDTAGMEKLLAADIRVLSDGGGEFNAARVPVTGVSRVVKFYLNLMKTYTGQMGVSLKWLNGLPAVITNFSNGRPGDPPRSVLQCDMDANGRIREIHAILASRKLAALGLP